MMTKTTLLLSIAVLALALSSGAAEVTLNPSADAGGWGPAPDQNFGDHYLFWNGLEENYCESVFYFDLYSYMGASLNSAQLELYIDSSWGTMPDNDHCGLCMNAAGWDEMTVTHNTMPGTWTDPFLELDAPMVGSWLVLDVTDFVDYWLSGTRNNYGFMIMCWPPMVYGGYYITSRESSTNKPKLILDYSGADVETVSWGAIKALDE
ncbi:MAG: DNRLRE domain-containing protein [Candidatus Coatesbacteria bacterium]|nr:DNRLRE domain-containing protein [Candidatus Coatesbacteria bacterium]